MSAMHQITNALRQTTGMLLLSLNKKKAYEVLLMFCYITL